MGILPAPATVRAAEHANLAAAARGRRVGLRDRADAQRDRVAAVACIPAAGAPAVTPAPSV